MNIQEYAITELTRSMKLAAEREEYQCAADMKRIISGIEKMRGETRLYTENDIAQLQNRIHKIVGNGEVMQEFNKLLGINAS
jgi:hypothetical protein